jgi:hypothetical protein
MISRPFFLPRRRKGREKSILSIAYRRKKIKNSNLGKSPEGPRKVLLFSYPVIIDFWPDFHYYSVRNDKKDQHFLQFILSLWKIWLRFHQLLIRILSIKIINK